MRFALIAATAVAVLDQAQPEPLQTPWEGVPEGFRNLPIGRLDFPADPAKWKVQRRKVKAIVLNALGELPARPAKPDVKIVRIDRKDGWRIEKFVFGNGVDSQVPGYIAIPEDGKQRHPAILTMHGHGSSKENMFGYEPTSQDVAELLAKQGYVVLGIDTTSTESERARGRRANSKPCGAAPIRKCPFSS
jgi:hypothetical protein